MKPIDIASLSQPISPDSPAGPDLEYDAGFVALEDAARVEPEQQFGDTIVAAEEPDWEKVHDLAVDLLSRSKDLRAATYLVQALVHLNGLAGLSHGVELIRALLEGFWDYIHPQLDPDDDLDPTARVNIVASLCDPEQVLASVRSASMVEVPGLGGISLRDLQIAKGELPPPPDVEEPIRLDTIEAAVRDVELPALQEVAVRIADAVRDTTAIEQLVTEKVGITHSVGLDALKDTLAEIQKFFQGQLKARGTGQIEGGEGNEATIGTSEEVADTGERKRLTGQITSTRDVTEALDKIIAYYATNEPSSPVPLLLQRARRLVASNFMEILRDIAPDALAQAERVTGIRSKTGAE
jgi:type VI secretion system protein ImpA